MGAAARLPSHLLVRPAWADEGPTLTELAMEAKARWGYDEAFMALCRDELTITGRRIGCERVRVAEVGGIAAGFSAMKAGEGKASIEDLFVSPRFTGAGLGQILVEDFLGYARRHGIAAVHVEADPNAAPFYAHLGFSQCGEVPSGSIPGRMLPLMEVRF